MDISKKIKETIDELNPAQKKKAIKCIKTAEMTEPVGRPPNPRERLLYKETVKNVKGPRGRGTVETAKDLLERRIKYYENELGEKLTDKEIKRIFSVELKKIADKEAVFLGPKYQSRIGKMEPGGVKKSGRSVLNEDGVYVPYVREVDPNPAIEEYKQRVKKIMKDKEKSERMDMGEEDTRGKELKAKAKAKERKTMGEEDAASKAIGKAREKERKRLKAAKEKAEAKAAKEKEAKEQEAMGEEDAASKAVGKAERKERKRLKAIENERRRAAKAAKAAKKTGSGYPMGHQSLRQNLVLQLIRPTNLMVESSNMNTREF